MSESLPLFPLQTVLFPGGRLQLKIFEQRYLDLMKNCLANDKPFGICAIREGQEVGGPAKPFEVGTAARIIHWDMPQTGIFHVTVEGQARFEIQNWHVEKNRLIVANVLPYSVEDPIAIPDELRLAVDVLKQLIQDSEPNHFGPDCHFDNAVWVGFRLSESLPFKLSIRQNFLEMNDSITRLRILNEFLRKQGN